MNWRVLIALNNGPLAVHAADVRGRIKRAVLGSVADSVMRHAPCPVMVIKAKE